MLSQELFEVAAPGSSPYLISGGQLWRFNGAWQLVTTSAGEQAVVAHGGLEGRGGPQPVGLGGLHVVVSVEQQGGGIRVDDHLCEDDRVAIGLDDLHFLEAGCPQVLREPGRTARDVLRMLGGRADTRDPEELAQLFLEAIPDAMLVEPGKRLLTATNAHTGTQPTCYRSSRQLLLAASSDRCWPQVREGPSCRTVFGEWRPPETRTAANRWLTGDDMELGAFSISLTVRDLEASREFYEKLGFEVTGGSSEQNYLILKNGDALIGLFEGMFDKNILTFNPGLSVRAEGPLDDFTDVRDIQKTLKGAGVKLTEEADEASSGAAHIVLEDPDGNPILIDQFF